MLDDKMIPISRELWNRLNALMGPYTHDEYIRYLLDTQMPDKPQLPKPFLWTQISLTTDTLARLEKAGYIGQSYDSLINDILDGRYLKPLPENAVIKPVAQGWIPPPPPIEKEV